MKSMKKMLSFLLALLLVMNLGTPAFAAETPAITLTVDKTDVAVGDTVTVTVGSTGISNVFGIGFKVNADKDVYEVESVETTWTSNNQLAAKGWIKIATFSSTGNTLTPPETIAVIKLKAKAAAETSSISLSSLEVTKTGADGTSTEIVTVTEPEAVTTKVVEQAACEHEWTDATCVSPKTCSLCGATDGEKNPDAHSYKDGKCEYCQTAEPVDPNTVKLEGNAEIGSIVFSGVTVKESEVTEGNNELVIDVTLDEATAKDATVNIAVNTVAGLLVVTPEEQEGYSTFTNTYYTGPATLNGTAPLSGGKGGFLFKAAPMGGDDFFYRINFTVYCDHVWTDATCVSPKTCSVCGATEGEKNPEAHNYVDGKCEYCGAASATTAGYTVSASEDVSITAGENAEVSITVAEAGSKAYNAYMLNITYPQDLTYVSASGSGVEGDNFQADHVAESRTIQIIGYGADKASGTAAAKLTFTGSTVGEYEVIISSAKVDTAASAPSQNTPDAAITDAATKITVTGYTVTLGEGLTADSFVAYPGNDYTFKATDADNYDYTVTAKVGEDSVEVTDNGDGTYTIPADKITGNITVSAVMKPKSYDVTYDGTTTENAATYNTSFVFTPEKEGYTVGGVTVTIGGKPYTGYSNVDGTYTIPGIDITGDIIITVDWIKKTPATVTVNKSEGIIGGENATQGTDYTFSFGETNRYDYDEETLVVMVGETDITEDVTKNQETGEYTIPGNLITGDITISIERTEKVTFTVEVSEYMTLNNGKMYLVTVKGVEDGKVAKYCGQNMFWSAQTLTTGENGEETIGYGAYAWLVISNEGLEAVKTAASENVTTAEGTSNLTVDYSGDVNGTDKIDVNDAQLVYNMYNAYYGDFTTVSMQKFLDADVNSDKIVNVTDAAAVVTAIINAK